MSNANFEGKEREKKEKKNFDQTQHTSPIKKEEWEIGNKFITSDDAEALRRLLTFLIVFLNIFLIIIKANLSLYQPYYN